MRTFLLLTAAAACALIGPAVAQDTPKSGGTLLVGINSDIRSLEPGINRDTNTDSVIHQMFEGLVAYRSDLTVGPALADSWTVSDDGRTYTFTLREGAKFHNGAPVTSAEVKWSWERLSGQAGWNCRNGFDGTAGAKVEAVEAPDPRTVVYKLAAPSGTFLKQLAIVQCGILVSHPSSVDDKGAWKTPVGSGPWSLKEWKNGQAVVLTRVADYKPSTAPANGYSGARIVHLDQLEFRVIPDSSAAAAALKAGAIDVLPAPNEEILDDLKKAGLNVQVSPGLAWDTLLINNRDPIFSNPKMRLALAHALDLKEIAAAGVNGLSEPNPSAIADASAYFDKTFRSWPEYDPRKSAALLKEAGYANQEIKIQTNQRYPTMYRNAVVIQAMLAAAGFNARIEVLEWATQLNNYLKRSFQLQSFAFSPRTDPALSYGTILADMEKFGWAQWDDPKALALLKESLGTGDEPRRREIFAELHGLMKAQIPTIGLYFEPTAAASQTRVKGWQTWPVDRPITWGVWKQ